MLSHRILAEIRVVNRVIARIADAMVRESLLPDFQVRPQLFLRSIREPAFDELDRLFEAGERSDDYVKVVGHDYEFVEQICVALIVIKSVDQQSCPRFGME